MRLSTRQGTCGIPRGPPEDCANTSCSPCILPLITLSNHLRITMTSLIQSRTWIGCTLLVVTCSLFRPSLASVTITGQEVLIHAESQWNESFTYQANEGLPSTGFTYTKRVGMDDSDWLTGFDPDDTMRLQANQVNTNTHGNVSFEGGLAAIWDAIPIGSWSPGSFTGKNKIIIDFEVDDPTAFSISGSIRSLGRTSAIGVGEIAEQITRVRLRQFDPVDQNVYFRQAIAEATETLSSEQDYRSLDFSDTLAVGTYRLVCETHFTVHLDSNNAAWPPDEYSEALAGQDWNASSPLLNSRMWDAYVTGLYEYTGPPLAMTTAPIPEPSSVVALLLPTLLYTRRQLRRHR